MTTADFNLNMTLYDANKNIMKKMAPVSENKMKLDFANVGAWMSSFPKATYFMLMCKERSDFNLIHIPSYNYMDATQEAREILDSRGTLLGINYVHGENCYECWVRQEEPEPEVFMYMLFEADFMVIEVP